MMMICSKKKKLKRFHLICFLFLFIFLSTESLDISYNQIERIDRNTLQNLRELRELRMAGNRLSIVNVDSIRFLNSLTTLDIRENQFQQIPLDVLNFLETHLQTLQLERKSHTNTHIDGFLFWPLWQITISGTQHLKHFTQFDEYILRHRKWNFKT